MNYSSMNLLDHPFSREIYIPKFADKRFPLEGYKEAAKILLDHPEDLRSISNVVHPLQRYIYEESFDADIHQRNAFFDDKKQALQQVLLAVHPLRGEQYLKGKFYALLAQSSVLLGRWMQAITFYEALLQQPGFLDSHFSQNHYCGELTQVARVIHNMCLLYALTGQSDRAVVLKNKFNQVFYLEESYAKSLILRTNMDAAEKVVNEFRRLNESANEINTFYYDKSLSGNFIQLDKPSLLELYKNELKTPYEVELKGVAEIHRHSNGQIYLHPESESWHRGEQLLVRIDQL